MARRSPISSLIKQVTGLTIAEFCENELHTEYRAFSVRLRRRRLYPTEVFYIVWRLKKSVQEIFGMSGHEILITAQGGPIADQVSTIITQMTPENREEMKALLGLSDVIAPYPPIPPPTPPKPAETPTTVEQPAPQPPKKDPLKDLFIDTYKDV